MEQNESTAIVKQEPKVINQMQPQGIEFLDMVTNVAKSIGIEQLSKEAQQYFTSELENKSRILIQVCFQLLKVNAA